MAGTPTTPNQLNKAVVAFLDGRRMKGYIYNFSAVKDSFYVLPQENSLRERGTQVAIRDLKAVFFVKDFAGNPEYHGSRATEQSTLGRKIEVTFRDEETILGLTQGYNREKLGFFMLPADSDSNAVRIFVVNQNVSQARFV